MAPPRPPNLSGLCVQTLETQDRTLHAIMTSKEVWKKKNAIEWLKVNKCLQVCLSWGNGFQTKIFNETSNTKMQHLKHIIVSPLFKFWIKSLKLVKLEQTPAF